MVDRALTFVFLKPGFGDLPYLLKRVEQVRVEHLLAIGLVEALDERVL